jgi:hypothetical protein
MLLYSYKKQKGDLNSKTKETKKQNIFCQKFTSKKIARPKH